MSEPVTVPATPMATRWGTYRWTALCVTIAIVYVFWNASFEEGRGYVLTARAGVQLFMMVTLLLLARLVFLSLSATQIQLLNGDIIFGRFPARRTVPNTIVAALQLLHKGNGRWEFNIVLNDAETPRVHFMVAKLEERPQVRQMADRIAALLQRPDLPVVEQDA